MALIGGELAGEDRCVCGPGLVVAGGGVGGLLPGVGFGLGGEAELARDVRRGAGLGAFGLAGAGFELAAGHAADDGGFVAYLQGADRGQAHAFEFGAAAVRKERDGLLGVGDPGGFPVGGGRCGPAGVFLTQGARCPGGQDAEVPGQPGFWAGGQLLAEGAGPVVEGGGELVGERRGGGGCALGPGDVVPQVGQDEALQAVVQDGGDGPGAVHRGGGEAVDEGAEVVSGELGGAEPLVQGLAGVLAVVPPGFGLGEPGLDLLVDAGGRVCLMAADHRVSRWPVPPDWSWAWRICSVADRSPSSRCRTPARTDSGVACW